MRFWMMIAMLALAVGCAGDESSPAGSTGTGGTGGGSDAGAGGGTGAMEPCTPGTPAQTRACTTQQGQAGQQTRQCIGGAWSAWGQCLAAGGNPGTQCPDADRDGYRSAQCDRDPRTGNDCNDQNQLVNPGAVENCGNNLDDNCNGQVDDPQTCGAACRDLDGDGFQDITCNPNRQGGGGDCNDANRNVNPGAPEVCGNFIDDDCKNGDKPCTACPPEADMDGDGFGNAAQCLAQDCDDRNEDVNPWATEICGDNIDQDCNGVDLQCPMNCTDVDRDGFGTGAGCLGPDCDDRNPAVNPGGVEIPGDMIDQDCNGSDLMPVMNCIDNDNDGYGNGQGCLGPDCDDGNPRVNPGRTEVCGNLLDDDCNNGDRVCVGQGSGNCVDNDNDGYGTQGMCPQGIGDCNDNDVNINPGRIEICDNVDNNCDGRVDECPFDDQVCDPQQQACVGGPGAPCRADMGCQVGLECNPDTNDCRVPDGEICQQGSDCNPTAECKLLEVCDEEAQRCYQARGGPCQVSCDCTDDYLCLDGEGVCVECLPGTGCFNEGNDNREACSDGGYCVQDVIIGGEGNDARIQLLREILECWNSWAGGGRVEGCDRILADDTLFLEGMMVQSFGGADTEHDSGRPCDDQYLEANGFNQGEIDLLDDLWGGCRDDPFNLLQVFWPDERPLRPGVIGEHCLYYHPNKSGFDGFIGIGSRREAIVIERCDLTVIE